MDTDDDDNVLVFILDKSVIYKEIFIQNII